tara:strand:+ start:60 stop:476 length:417 start_codon:yes stop_codon:yes gene_type:complete
MPHPKIKISDNEGNTVGVTDNKLDVNLEFNPADIDIGDVEIKGHATFNTYPQFAVGTALVQLSTGIGVTYALVKEMIIQADFDNTSFVMVGDGDIAANETDGVRIDAGDTLILPFVNTTEVFFRSDTADQKINVSLLY